MELRLPNFTGQTVEELLPQIKSYLYSTVEQLNWALSTVEKNYASIKKESEIAVKNQSSPEKAEETFSQLKDLIIKSSDIVSAYKEELERSYDQKYVAQSDVGTYIKEGTTAILEGPDGISVRLRNTEKLAAENKETIRKNDGYIQVGKVGEDENGDVIGILIKDGTENGAVFARYTAEGSTLYNEAGRETLKIADGKTKLTGRVSIEDAEGRAASLSFKGNGLTGYILDPSDGLGLYWGGE